MDMVQKQITHEDDRWHGMDLHVIRPDVTPAEEEPWKGVLPEQYVKTLADRYKDLNNLCVPPPAPAPVPEVVPAKVIPPQTEAVVVGREQLKNIDTTV